MIKPPDKIYLQIEDCDYIDESTWCTDKINDTDIEYQRSTLSSNDIDCPFCDEQGFDGPGLKWHLLHHCDAFKNTEEI